MELRDRIIDNIREYDASQLASFIQNGVFASLEDLIDECGGELGHSKREEIKRILSLGPATAPGIQGNPDDRAFATLSEDSSVEELQDFLDAFPDSQHYTTVKRWKQAKQTAGPSDSEAAIAWAAIRPTNPDVNQTLEFLQHYPGFVAASEYLNNLILFGQKTELDMLRDFLKAVNSKGFADGQIFNELKDRLDAGRITKNDILALMREDINVFSAYLVNKLIFEIHVLSYADILMLGLDMSDAQRFIRNLDAKHNGVEVVPSLNLNRSNSFPIIPEGYTEVYFWGLPSSGKTCALGGILSVARNGSVCSFEQLPCNASDYMAILSEIFTMNDTDGPASILPPGTNTTTVADMLFNLTTAKYPDKIYPLAFIDLAGEICGIMGDELNGQLSEANEEVLAKVINLLHRPNRKIHYFVVEYGSHDKIYRGKTTATNLGNVQAFIKKNGVFDHNTDSINILITKCDKAEKDAAAAGVSLEEHLQAYVSKYYQGFFAGLQALCHEKSINGGRLRFKPFTMGKVAFKNYCIFDSSHSLSVVDDILARTTPIDRSKMGKLSKKLRS